MKTDKGRQQDSQKEFQAACEKNGYKYVICRSFDDFKREIESYLYRVDPDADNRKLLE